MRLLFIGVFFIQCAFAATGTVAIGNLAVAFQGKGYQSTPENPLKGPMNDLWCQASDNGEHKEIANARFVRVHDRKHFEATRGYKKPGSFHYAHIDDDSKKAILIFGNVAVTEAAKYRCEITTSDGDHVFGNMFAYSHPVIHTNTSWGVYKPDDNQENELVAKQAIYTDLDASAQLDCPVVGYPHPSVVWYKDGLPIDAGSKYVMRHRGKHLTVKNITEADLGVYRCRAYNTFASVVDGAESDHEVTLDISLQLNNPIETPIFDTCRFGWLYPLILIIIILLLLFIIIYSCKAYGKWKSDQYNVAKREKQYRVDEEKKMVDEP